MSFSFFRNKIGVGFFISVLFILGGISQASAYTFSYYYFDPSIVTGQTTNWWETCSGSLNTGNSNSIYSVGDIVTVNGSLESTNVEYLSSCLLRYPADFSFVNTQVPLGQKAALAFISGSKPLSNLGMNIPGSYDLTFVVFSTSVNTGADTFNLPITVVTAVSPTVDVWLGSLNEVKSFATKLVSNVSSYFSSPVYAQTKVATDTDKTAVKTPTATGIILADVNIVDVIATSTNGVFSGRFSIQGKLGQQNDVHYGVMVLDDKDIILDAKELGVIPKISQGETNRYTLKYQLPTYVSGNVRVLLVAETSGGLVLSTNQIFKGNVAGTKNNFLCTYIAGTKTSKISRTECLSPKDTSINVSYGVGSIFATSTLIETINLKAGKKVTLSPNLAPGEYFATIVTKAGEKRILPATKEGVYGDISSVVVHTGETLNVVKVAVFANVSTSSVVVANLVGNNGEECGKAETEVKGVAAEVSIATKCTTGTIMITLKDRQGTVMSTSSEPFSVLTFVRDTPKVAERKGMTANDLMLISLVGLVGVLGALIYFRKKNEMEMVKGIDKEIISNEEVIKIEEDSKPVVI